jgi:hypothetical protein
MPFYGSARPYAAATWEVTIGAMIQDIHRNPVTKGTAVWFSINNEFEGWTPEDPLSLSIRPFSYVYNVSAEGDSLPGVAYTSMIYHGSLSNLAVPIKIDIGNFTTTGITILPMNQVNIEVVRAPGFVEWDTRGMNPVPPSNHPSQLREVLFTVTVRDGLQNPMNNAILYFMEDDGFLMDRGTPGYIPSLHGGPTNLPYPEWPEDLNHMGQPANTPNMAPTDVMGQQRKKWFSYRNLPQALEQPSEGSASLEIAVGGTDQRVVVQWILRWHHDDD